MKYNLLFKIMGAFIALLIIGACSDDKMDEIGLNPNSPVEATSNSLVAQATLTTAFEVNGTDLAWYASVFVEQTVGVHGQLETADKRTGINASIANNNWNGLYAGTLKDLQDVIDICSEGGAEAGNNTTLGIAKILMAYNFSVATDLWGEVPFTEALQGSDIRTPKFDSESTVYAGIINLLKEGIVDLNKESSGNPGASDFFYSGIQADWIAAANSFLMRYYNRLSNINSAYADSALLVLPLAFQTAADNMIFDSYTDDATGQNPWWQEEVDRGHHAVSKTLDDILVSLSDPRRDLFFDTIATGIINSAPPGTALTDQAGVIYSRFTGNYLSKASAMPIITYDEVKFIEAEAQLRKSNNIEAYAAYIEGIEEAMLREGVDTTSINNYLVQPNIALGANNLTETAIITQKYISFWLFNPIEAYNDYRRTRIPTLKNSVGPAPERFPYPQDEAASNADNMPDKGSTAKVWWAK